jgi:xylan 1,4-beta-xylosidase
MKNILAKVLISSAFFTAAGTVALSAAPNPYKNTFCNPVNINYNFWASYREAADPGIVVFKNDYYLFASHSGGYWWSTDMLNWNFVRPSGLNVDSYAPTVEILGDTMYFTAGGASIYKTTNPKGGVWTVAGNSVPIDPCLFKDDDAKFYCYFGCSANGTINVTQLDPAHNFSFTGKLDTCIISNRNSHGFEVPGDFNESPANDSWIEGSWLTKYKGVYYLQYAVPGTQYRSYADGCYTASSARGPFAFCANSPICMKPGGFVTGTGHSCTFKDIAGNYWHVTTVVVSVAHGFERRLAIFPAGFDAAGWLHSDTYLGDYPQYLPGKALANAENNLFGCMLLSFKKPCSASSALSGHPVSDAFDENIKTWWSAASNNSGEWLRVDLGKSCEIGAIQTNFAEQDITYAGGRGTSFSHKYKIEGTEDTTGTWKMLVNKTAHSADVPHDYAPLDSIVNIRYIKITNAGPMPGGGKFAIRDLRIFGNAHCNPPAGATAFSVSRTTVDKRTATVTWTKVADADGYIIRLGIAPDKLYNNYQVLSKDSVSCVIRSLNVGVTYYFSLDTYNSCGVTKGVVVKRDDNVTSAGMPILRRSGVSGRGTFTIIGSRFAVPVELEGKSYTARVYDISGRLLYIGIVHTGVVDFSKNIQTRRSVYFVNLSPKR